MRPSADISSSKRFLPGLCESGCPALLTSDLHCVRSISNSPQELDIGAGLLFGNLCLLLRAYWSRITSVKARQRPFIDLDMINEILPELTRLSTILDIYEERVTIVYGPKWPDHLAFWTRVIRFFCERLPEATNRRRQRRHATENWLTARTIRSFPCYAVCFGRTGKRSPQGDPGKHFDRPIVGSSDCAG